MQYRVYTRPPENIIMNRIGIKRVKYDLSPARVTIAASNNTLHNRYCDVIIKATRVQVKHDVSRYVFDLLAVYVKQEMKI